MVVCGLINRAVLRPNTDSLCGMQELTWCGVDTHPATLYPATTAEQPPAGDAFGSLAAAGATLQPLLLPDGHSDKTADGKGNSLLQHTAGRVVISGGLGGVGSLVGAWLSVNATVYSAGDPAAATGAPDIVLLGRSGRCGVSPLVATLQQSAVPVTMARCDVSCAAEAAEVAAGSGKPLAGIIHAGGVLADGMIPNQTASGIRSVFAPKVNAVRVLEKQSA